MGRDEALQSDITEMIIQDGIVSRSSILKKYEKNTRSQLTRKPFKKRHPQSIRDALASRSEPRKFQIAFEKTAGQGQPEKWYTATMYGIKWFLDKKKPTPNYLWETLCMLSSNLQRRSNSKIYKSEKDDVSRLHDVVEYYIEHILNVSMSQFIHPTFFTLLKDLPFLYEDKEKSNKILPILEILGESLFLSEYEIKQKIKELYYDKIKSVSEDGVEQGIKNFFLALLETGFFIKRNADQTKFGLSQLGLIFLCRHIHEKLKGSSAYGYSEIDVAQLTHRPQDIPFFQLSDREKDIFKKIIQPSEKNPSKIGPTEEQVKNILKKHLHLFPEILNQDRIDIRPYEIVALFVLLFFRYDDIPYVIPRESEEEFLLLQKQNYKQAVYFKTLEKFISSGFSFVHDWLNHRDHSVGEEINKKEKLLSQDILTRLDAILELIISYKKNPVSSGNNIKPIIDVLYLLNELEGIMHTHATIHFQSGGEPNSMFLYALGIKSLENVITFRFLTLFKALYQDEWNVSVKKELRDSYAKWKENIES